MYAQHKIGVILPARGDLLYLQQRIRALPAFIDRIYLMGEAETDPSLSEGLPVTFISRLPSLPPEEPMGTALHLALDEGLDIIAVLPENDGRDPTLIPHVIDPIVWRKAEYTRGEWIAEPEGSPDSVAIPTTESGSFSVSAVSRDTITSPLTELLDGGYTAFSRTVAVRFSNLLSHNGKRILAAIPCYNEEVAIGSIVLRTRKNVNEVLVVDDGSRDRTADVAREAGATVVTHPSNQGYGSGLRTCFEYAREHHYDAMVVLDGDGQHDPDAIPFFFKTMETEHADLVIGSRFHRESNHIPAYRKVGMKVLDRFTNIAGDLQVTDTQSGYRLYGRRAIEAIDITTTDMSAGSEILTQVRDHHLRVAEIPIVVRYDIKKTSSEHPLTHGLRVLDSLLWHIVQRRPLLYIGVPGIIMTVVGIYFGLTLLQLYNREQYFSLPLSILVAIFLILGALSMFMGVMLNVIAKIMSRYERYANGTSLNGKLNGSR